MRRYRYFDDAVCITENFKRFADTVFTHNYRPTFRSYDELEPHRLRYAAKDEQGTCIITDTLNQLQEEIRSCGSPKQLHSLLHKIIDIGKLCRSIRDYQRDPKNYSGFQPEYWHSEYNPEHFSLLAEFCQFLAEFCIKKLLYASYVYYLLLMIERSLFGTNRKHLKTRIDESPPLPPPIFLRPQIQPNSPNFAA